MTIPEVLLSFFYYVLPAFLLFYMAVDIYLRNRRKTEHQLAAAIVLCYVGLFLAEYVRFLLPIEHSPFMVTFIFGNIGAVMPSLTLHFLLKVTELDTKLSRRWFPWLLYVPALVVPLTLFTQKNIINSQNFIYSGVWKTPVYNAPYFTAVTISVLFMITYVVILTIANRRENSTTRKKMIRWLTAAVIINSLWIIVFGYVHFGGLLPPHPYIFAGVLWAVFLRRAMYKFDFLSAHSYRFEKLFNLNPSMLLLLDANRSIKEMNPSARALLNGVRIKQDFSQYLVQQERWNELFDQVIHEKTKFKNKEFQLMLNERCYDVMMDGDFVYMDHQPHFILILRDVTKEKRHAENIHYLAYHDPLTTLPNRRYFQEEVTNKLQQGEEEREWMLILLDLDGFKSVNDRYGHQVGDEFLQFTASVLKALAPINGMVARLAGDEFVFFLPVNGHEEVKTFIMNVNGKIRSEQFVKGTITIPLRISFGISLSPSDGDDYDTLLNMADARMYQMKQENESFRDQMWEMLQ